MKILNINNSFKKKHSNKKIGFLNCLQIPTMYRKCHWNKSQDERESFTNNGSIFYTCILIQRNKSINFIFRMESGGEKGFFKLHLNFITDFTFCNIKEYFDKEYLINEAKPFI